MSGLGVSFVRYRSVKKAVQLQNKLMIKQQTSARISAYCMLSGTLYSSKTENTLHCMKLQPIRMASGLGLKLVTVD